MIKYVIQVAYIMHIRYNDENKICSLYIFYYGEIGQYSYIFLVFILCSKSCSKISLIG